MVRVRLEIVGGREAGFRSGSHKQHFPAEPYETWRVVVTTSAGQHLGSTRFSLVRGKQTISENAQPAAEKANAPSKSADPKANQRRANPPTATSQPATTPPPQPTMPTPNKPQKIDTSAGKQAPA